MEDSKVDNLINIKESEKGPRKPRVLIVEDDDFIDMYLHEILNDSTEIEAGTYKSVQQATEMLDKKTDSDPKIDVLVTDLGLHGDPIGGTKVVEPFRKKYPNASIIFVTGNPYKLDDLYTPDQREKIKFDVVGKPFTPPVLMRKIEAIKKSINSSPQA